jgi:fimbrial chaperone protein
MNLNRNRRIFLFSLFLASLLVVLFAPMQVRAWELDPVQLELPARQPTAAVTIKNGADEPVTIQIQALSWTQIEGKDLYAATGELIASPGLVTLAPHAQQLIRVGLRRKTDNDVELAYRLNFQEMPAQASSDLPAGKSALLRIGMPVFVQPNAGNTALKLRWSMLRSSDGIIKISVLNQSNSRVKVLDYSVYGSAVDKPIASMSGASYVLADQTHTWLLKTKLSGKVSDEPLRIKAYTDAGVVETELLPELP